MIRKLLVANRGEIAVRIIRTAREMGIRTVAVYSDADSAAMHAALADEKMPLGPPEPAHSYLDIAKVVAAAKDSGCDAVHPGYGFLSERPEFAEACVQEGLVFVGPSAEAMRRLGSKIEAKRIAEEVGVPIVPGLFDPAASPEELRSAAGRIGYPVMLKASAGGGGRGMRLVRTEAEFMDALLMGSDEALKAFGDGTMMVEKLIERPRHIEVQILADSHGNVATLFERECSLQRRHQKLVEETPSPFFSGERESRWEEMREAARRLAKAVGYAGAGTVEFIVDAPTGAFYFLEVNARLQVEHPVTEAITALDLVEWQLRIAGGEALQISEGLFEGNRQAMAGHSIEARIVAEDPANGFAPSVGKILAWAEPRNPSIRVDTGFGPGAEVSRYYDSLLAKVIAHGSTREQAIRRLREALLDMHVVGIKTNIAYLIDVLDHPLFVSGDIDTGFLGREFGEWGPSAAPPELLSIAAYAPISQEQEAVDRRIGAWSSGDGFRNASA